MGLFGGSSSSGKYTCSKCKGTGHNRRSCGKSVPTMLPPEGERIWACEPGGPEPVSASDYTSQYEAFYATRTGSGAEYSAEVDFKPVSPRDIQEGDSVRDSMGRAKKVRKVTRAFDEERGYRLGSRGNTFVEYEDGSLETFSHSEMNDQRIHVARKPQSTSATAQLGATKPNPGPSGSFESASPRGIAKGDSVRTPDGEVKMVREVTNNYDEDLGYRPGSRGNTVVEYEDGTMDRFSHSEMNDQRIDIMRKPKRSVVTAF